MPLPWVSFSALDAICIMETHLYDFLHLSQRLHWQPGLKKRNVPHEYRLHSNPCSRHARRDHRLATLAIGLSWPCSMSRGQRRLARHRRAVRRSANRPGLDRRRLYLAFAALLRGRRAGRPLRAKTIYQAGLAVFTLASLLCGMAPDGPALIAARMLQGVGAALFMPSSLSLLTHAYGRTHAQPHAGRLVRHQAVAGASAPLLGGVLIHQFGWRGIFLINLPLGLAGLWLASRRIQQAPRRPRALNASSHLLGMVVLATASYALIEGNAYGWSSPRIATAIALALAAAILLARERHADPILPHRAVRNATLAAANGVDSWSIWRLRPAVPDQPVSAGARRGRVADRHPDGADAGDILDRQPGSAASRRAGMCRLRCWAASIATVLSAASIVAMSPGMPYWCLRCWRPAPICLGLVVPAMTSLVMQVSGTAHANSGAAALNANRQSGTLVGVALMGTILHRAPTGTTACPWPTPSSRPVICAPACWPRAISAVHAIVDATRGPLQPRRMATPRPAK